jgi:hypothetical protein
MAIKSVPMPTAVGPPIKFGRAGQKIVGRNCLAVRSRCLFSPCRQPAIGHHPNDQQSHKRLNGRKLGIGDPRRARSDTPVEAAEFRR